MRIFRESRLRARIARAVVQLLTVAAVFAGTTLARGADSVVVSVQNTTGVWVSDLHVTFTGTGGNITVPPWTAIVPGCPPPAVPSNGVVTNTAVIDWGAPCVAPGAWVHFNALTVNGPLGIASARWTLNGVFIGGFVPARGRRMGPGGGGGLPPGPFWTWAVQERVGPWGRTRYTPWRRAPNGTCWARWCCRPAGWRWTRIVLYCYVNRFGRIIRIGPCVPLTPWRRDGWRRAKYRWQITTIRPPGVIMHGGDGSLIIGPPKEEAIPNPGQLGPQDQMSELAYTDDNGLTYNQGYDFRTCFSDVGMAMGIDDDLTPDLSFNQALQRLAPGYIAASQSYQKLAQQCSAVLAHEPNSALQIIQTELVQLSLASQQIASQLSTGLPTNPTPFEQSRLSLSNIATQFVNLNTNARFDSTRDNLNRAVEGYQIARDRVAAGLGVPANADDFLWAMFMRIPSSLNVAATTCEPCIRFRYSNNTSFIWNISQTHGATMSIHDGTNFNLINEFTLPMNDDSHLFLPISDLASGQVGFFSRRADRLAGNSLLSAVTDGQRFVGTGLAGDVDVDNQITSIDLNMVSADVGQGGMDAPFVPKTDINNDGGVTANDVNMVAANVGILGGGFVDIYGRINPGDWGGMIEGLIFDVEIRDPSNGAVLDRQTVTLSDGDPNPAVNFSVKSGWIGDLQLSVKAPRWLRRTVNFNLPNYGFTGLTLHLTNGDIDDDNEVGISDFALLSSAYGSFPGDFNWDDYADLNGDDECSIADYAIMSSHYGEFGDE